MEMRTVYRYENENGNGPYRGGWPDWRAHDELCNAHCDPVGHPTWASYQDWASRREIPAYTGYYHLAGCDSRESLEAWFDGFHEALRDNGFTIREYTVPAHQVIDSTSGLQVAFDPRNAVVA